MFEAVVERGALSGGGFHEEGDFGRGVFENLGSFFGNLSEAFFFALFHVGSHVADDVWDAELTASGEFSGESVDRFLFDFGIGGAEVDEVGIVGDDVGVSDGGFGEGLIEEGDLFWGDVF